MTRADTEARGHQEVLPGTDPRQGQGDHSAQEDDGALDPHQGVHVQAVVDVSGLVEDGEGVGEDDGPDLVVRADHVQGHEGQPVDRVDAVREQDEARLIEPARALAGLERVQSGGDNEEEREEESRHETCVNTLELKLKQIRN